MPSMKNIYLIISREYLERVRKKSFIVVTLLMPLLMIGLMVAPTLMMLYSGSDLKRIAVIDRSGIVASELVSSAEVEFVREEQRTKDEACRIYNDDSDIFGVLYIGSDIESRDSVQLITNSSSSLMLEENIAGQISSIVEREKLRRYNIDNLETILAEV